MEEREAIRECLAWSIPPGGVAIVVESHGFALRLPSLGRIRWRGRGADVCWRMKYVSTCDRWDTYRLLYLCNRLNIAVRISKILISDSSSYLSNGALFTRFSHEISLVSTTWQFGRHMRVTSRINVICVNSLTNILLLVLRREARRRIHSSFISCHLCGSANSPRPSV